jgi:BirA family biotin operon repressor/biotin-[acetyl-CoA-carboxylase] ligase
MEAETDRIIFINIGIGVNVNNDPTPAEPNAISLKKILGRPVSRKELLTEFLDRFERRVTPGYLDTVVQEWKQCSNTVGRHVNVITPSETFEGTAVDVDENGALVLMGADGSTRKIICGDCFHRPG